MKNLMKSAVDTLYRLLWLRDTIPWPTTRN